MKPLSPEAGVVVKAQFGIRGVNLPINRLTIDESIAFSYLSLRCFGQGIHFQLETIHFDEHVVQTPHLDSISFSM